ncbi:MAG: ATPase [Methanosarcinales archaeon]|nr:MAG: ATPase [Methanosarcinales archaeon]
MPELKSFYLERDELNRKLGDGFPPGSLVVIEGGNGSGKSTISQRICYGMVDNGTTVTLVSTQQTTKGFINQMYSLDYPIASHLLKGKLLFIPVIPLVRAAKTRNDFLQRLMGAKELFANDVIIIDTISALIRYSADAEKTLDLVSFFKKLNGIGKIIIITLEPDQLDENIMSVLHSSSDIYISLNVKASGNEIKRTIVVNKFTGAKGQVTQMVGFRIEPNVGLVIEISAVS